MVSDGCTLGCLVGDISITVGRELSVREGSIEADGISLNFIVGERLTLTHKKMALCSWKT